MGVTVAAPAKINLTLDVTGRLPNGYHTVEMVMQTIDLTDTVQVSPAQSFSLSVGETDLPTDESNTAYKAVKFYSEAVGIPPHFAVTLHKNIPMQAGLAGGSADAAGVLVACNALCGERLSVEALCEIGAKIGADVPFCIRGGTMLATGIGTDLETFPAMSDCYIVVAKPYCGVSTAAAYAAIDSMPYPSETHTAAMRTALMADDVSAVGKELYNRFYDTLRIREVQTLVQQLRENGACGATMTGSGSAVIGLFTDEQTAKKCADMLKLFCEQTAVCRPWQGGPRVITSV